MNPNIHQINEILEDLWNIHLILCGTSISIFTLFYSFIQNKRDELRVISDQVKGGNNDSILLQKEKFAISYIRKMIKSNKYITYIIVATFFLSASAWSALRILPDERFILKLNTLNVISILTIITLLCFIYLLRKGWYEYNNKSKI